MVKNVKIPKENFSFFNDAPLFSECNAENLEHFYNKITKPLFNQITALPINYDSFKMFWFLDLKKTSAQRDQILTPCKQKVIDFNPFWSQMAKKSISKETLKTDF